MKRKTGKQQLQQLAWRHPWDERIRTLLEKLLLEVVTPPHDWNSHLKHIRDGQRARAAKRKHKQGERHHPEVEEDVTVTSTHSFVLKDCKLKSLEDTTLNDEPTHQWSVFKDNVTLLPAQPSNDIAQCCKHIAHPHWFWFHCKWQNLHIWSSYCICCVKHCIKSSLIIWTSLGFKTHPASAYKPVRLASALWHLHYIVIIQGSPSSKILTQKFKLFNAP